MVTALESPLAVRPTAQLRGAATLFGPRVNRADLLSLEVPAPARRVRLHVVRNHAVEHVTSLFPALLSPWRVALDISFSDYDDSLPLADLPTDAIILIWPEVGRLRFGADATATAHWLREKLRATRALTDAPIIAIAGINALGCPWPAIDRAALTSGIPGCGLFDLSPALSALNGCPLFDARAARFSGTPFSSAFLVATAQALVAGPVARAAGLGLKAIVCDLDGTLYDGVLGEDGPRGLRLTPAHATVQRRLRELRDAGLLLAILSRNVPADVSALFAERSDFPLRAEDFTVIEASWDAKRDGLGRVLSALHIGAEHALVLDDNPGELLDIGRAWPDTHLVPADRPDVTLAALHNFPGITGFGAQGGPDRQADLQAAIQRQSLATSQSRESYLAELAMSLHYRLNDPSTLDRAAELTAKTNQFNLTLNRTSAARIHQLATTIPGGFVLTVGLEDRLSDSGIVAVWCGRVDGAQLVTEDLVISCRALGRQVEGLMLEEAFHFVGTQLSTPGIALPWVRGPRNQPALDWLHQLQPTSTTSPVLIAVPAAPQVDQLGIILTHAHHAS